MSETKRFSSFGGWTTRPRQTQSAPVQKVTPSSAPDAAPKTTTSPKPVARSQPARPVTPHRSGTGFMRGFGSVFPRKLASAAGNANPVSPTRAVQQSQSSPAPGPAAPARTAKAPEPSQVQASPPVARSFGWGRGPTREASKPAPGPAVATSAPVVSATSSPVGTAAPDSAPSEAAPSAPAAAKPSGLRRRGAMMDDDGQSDPVVPAEATSSAPATAKPSGLRRRSSMMGDDGQSDPVAPSEAAPSAPAATKKSGLRRRGAMMDDDGSPEMTVDSDVTGFGGYSMDGFDDIPPDGMDAAPPAPSAPAASPASGPATGLQGLRRRSGGMSAQLNEDFELGEPPEYVTAPSHEQQAPPKDEPKALKGVVSKVIFKKPDNSFFILGMKPNKDQEIPGDGKMRVAIFLNEPPFMPEEGDLLEATGTWSEQRNEMRFSARTVRLVVPKNNSGIRKFLKKDVAGVGDAAINRLFEYFGGRIFEVIDKEEELIKSGITEQQAQSIVRSWQANEYYNELSVKLIGLGLNKTVTHKIIEKYGAGVHAILDENPWELTEIPGVAFPSADAVALRMGHAKNSRMRIQAGVDWALVRETEDAGHCALPKTVLVERAARLLGIKGYEVSETLNMMLSEGLGNITADPVSNMVYPSDIYEAEVDVADRLARMAAAPPRMSQEDAERLIRTAENQVGKRLDESQFPAAVVAVRYKVCVVTGGPGTGKSTTLEVIIRALENEGRNFSLACPTGKGAKRMSEASGYPAKTIHSQLGYNAETGEFRYDKTNPIIAFNADGDETPANHFVNDEQSMVDIEIMRSQLDAMSEDACFIMVGDYDQLQSVGRGAVLMDIIQSGVIPVARLTKPHRSGAGSGIAVAAHRINNREMPLAPGEELSGFTMIEAHDDAIMGVVEKLVADDFPRYGISIRDDVVLLSAIKKGNLGVNTMNRFIKHLTNPAYKDEMSYAVSDSNDVTTYYSVDDVVMQTKNNKQLGTMNGETGKVLDIKVLGEGKKTDVEMQIAFDNLGQIYNKKALVHTQLAYAGTVHKWQGSERPVVIVIVPKSHAKMLTKQGLYTALTRAKLECYFVGSTEALRTAINRDDDIRHTGLKDRIVTAYQRYENTVLADGIDATLIPDDQLAIARDRGLA